MLYVNERRIIIGDSHVSVFSGLKGIIPEYPVKVINRKVDNIIPIRVGTYTAYNLLNKEEEIKKIILENIKTKNDKIGFLFGEIDCRIHIMKHYLDSFGSYSKGDMVEMVVKRYIDLVKSIGLSIEDKFFVVPPPPQHAPESFMYEDKQGKERKTSGSIEERKEISGLFYEVLKKYCIENNIMFINVYPEFFDNNGNIIEDYFYDEVHLSIKALELYKNGFAKNNIIIDISKTNVTEEILDDNQPAGNVLKANSDMNSVSYKCSLCGRIFLRSVKNGDLFPDVLRCVYGCNGAVVLSVINNKK